MQSRIKPASRHRVRIRQWIWLLVSVILFSLSSCRSEIPLLSPEPEWAFTDLRILDASDASFPEQDILAVYLRELENELQIRIDFLDLNIVPSTDIYLALDSFPGGVNELPWHAQIDIDWDTLLVIPASGELQVLKPDLHPLPGSGLRIIRDPIQDTIIISLLPGSLPGGDLPENVQVFTTPAGSTAVGDEVTAFQSDAFAPAPAPVLLAFWDTLPAYTPASGLRRWDGAHTGPLGGRHGLYNLLRTARARQIPLALLDLKTSAALSALDNVGGLSMVQELAERGDLILPDVQPGFIPVESNASTGQVQTLNWDNKVMLDQNRVVAAQFGFPASPFLYSPAGLPHNLADRTRLVITFNPDRSTPQWTRWQQQIVLELPPNLPQGVPTINGPDLALRKQMIQAALDSAKQSGAGPVVLGGDLPASAWGNPEIARTNFSYLTSHPWIKLLNGYDLLGLPTPSIPTGAASAGFSQTFAEFDQAPAGAPNNNLGEAAWQAYASLQAPVFPHPPELPVLREGYAGIVQVLLVAARWAEVPVPIQDCARDIDLDGKPECLLGSQQLLAVIQPENGELTFVFAKSQDGAHQLIGPGYQFITGLSESQSWVIGAGFDSDPSAGQGAFRDPVSPDAVQPVYNLAVADNELTFISEDGSIQKNYRLIEDRLVIILKQNSPNPYELPLAFDPWQRFTPGWSHQFAAEATPTGWFWGLKSGPVVSVDSNMPMQLHSFLDSMDTIGQPEDPNQEHPAGHWLPFPTANLVLEPGNPVWLSIRLVESLPDR